MASKVCQNGKHWGRRCRLRSFNYGKSITRRLLIGIAGGPVASLLLFVTTVIFIITMQLWQNLMYLVPTVPVILFSAMPVLSQVFTNGGIRNGGSIRSHGQKIKLLLKDDLEALRLTASHLIATQNMTGAHPRDWNYDLLKQAAHGACRSWRFLFLFAYAYTAALSHQDSTLAGEYIDAIKAYFESNDPELESSDTNNFLKHMFYLDIVFFEAYRRNDLVTAYRWFEQVPDRDELKQVRNGTQAAILFAEGQYPASIEKARIGKFNKIRSSCSLVAIFGQPRCLTN